MKKGNHVKRDKLYYVKRGIFGWAYKLRWVYRGDTRPIEKGWERISRLEARNLAGAEHYRQNVKNLPPRADCLIWPYGLTGLQRETMKQGKDYDVLPGYIVQFLGKMKGVDQS